MKKLSIYTFLIVFISLYSCNTPSGEKNEGANETNTEEIIDSNTIENPEDISHPSSTINTDTSGFIQKDAFSISNIQQPNNSNSSMGDISICNEFKLLTAEEITTIIQKASPMTGVEQHHLFDHLPCNITAKIQQGELTYDLDINSGAFLHISSSDTMYIYGNFDKELDKYFMSAPMTEEEIRGE